MKPFNTQLILRLFFVFCCLILRGSAAGSNEPQKSHREILKEVQGMATMDIVRIANSYSFKDLNTALIYANIALEQAKTSKDPQLIFDVKRAIGFIYEDNAIVPKALECYTNAIKDAEALGDTALTNIYNDLALVSRKEGNFRIAYNYYDKCIFYAKRISDTQMIASSYHGLGHLHKEVGIYDRAVDYYLQSLALSEKTNNPIDIIVSHNDISDLYLRAKEYEKALKHVEKAYQLAYDYHKSHPIEADAVVQLASVINRYGNILVSRKDYKAALIKYEEAFALYKGMRYKVCIARCAMYIANVYVLQKDFVKAEMKFNECLKDEKLFLNTDLAELYFKIGAFNLERKQPKLAEEALKKSLAIANKYDLKEFAQQANYQMFLIYMNAHENDKALNYLNLANNLRDSLYNTEKTRRTAEIEFKFDIEKKENEIRAFQMREKDSSLRENKLMLIASIIVFAMVILFLVYIIQMRDKNFKTLQQKNDEVELQYRKLEESNEILSQFAYAAAHDLKEPLRSIGSYIGLIQMRYGKDLPDEAKDYMKFVHSGVKRMYSLLTDLLDFSQVISQQPGNEEVCPFNILNEVQDNLRSAIEAKNAQIIYENNLPNIKMNSLHMMQLFQNLIGNALKFTEKSPIVRIEAKEENGAILMTVADNGIGIKKEYASKIFVLFQQLNKKEQFDGTGIGLTICKNIVEKYNGKIWFESGENEGTKFFISIPVPAQAA